MADPARLQHDCIALQKAPLLSMFQKQCNSSSITHHKHWVASLPFHSDRSCKSCLSRFLVSCHLCLCCCCSFCLLSAGKALLCGHLKLQPLETLQLVPRSSLPAALLCLQLCQLALHSGMLCLSLDEGLQHVNLAWGLERMLNTIRPRIRLGPGSYSARTTKMLAP